MKNLYNTFKKSLYNPSFYQSTADLTPSESFRHYMKCVTVLAAVMTVVLGLFFIHAGILFIKNGAPGLVRNYYPKELVVRVEKGVVSANVSMPYFVPVRTPSGATSTIGSVQNLLVVDTAHEFDKKTFESFKTYALLTKTDLVTSNNDGQITIQALSGAPSFTVSQEVLLSWIEKIRQSYVLISIIAVVALFIIFMLGYLIYLVPLLLFALIPLLIGWVKKTPITYGAAYKMSLYAIIPALVVRTALNLVGLFILPSYLTFLIFMLIIAVNMRDSAQPQLFEN
jgi:hypothetical protein